MKLHIQILFFIGVVLFITSCNKFEPLSRNIDANSTEELKSFSAEDENISNVLITDPENEDEIEPSITDPENEEDKQSN